MERRVIWVAVVSVASMAAFCFGFAFDRLFNKQYGTFSVHQEILVLSTHWGGYSSETFSQVNLEADEHLKTLLRLRAFRARCLVIPETGGYKILFLSDDRHDQFPAEIVADTSDFVRIRLVAIGNQERLQNSAELSSELAPNPGH